MIITRERILSRLKNLEDNLRKSGKPNAANVCLDARDEIIRLTEAGRPKPQTYAEIVAEKLAGFTE